MKQLLNLGCLYNILSSLNFPLIISTGISNSCTLLYIYSVYKKRLVFEIQISHNYCDLIVLNCVELMISNKNVSYLQKTSIGHVL